jgi:flagellar biosynthesis protein FlhG
LIKAANLDTGVKNFAIVVNMAENKSVAKTSFEKFREIAMRFLDVNLHYGGMIPHSMDIKYAVAQRKPVTIDKPNALVSASFREVAKTLLKVPVVKTDSLKFFGNIGEK